MENLQKLIDFLRSKEITEGELKAVYGSFFRQEYDRGFNNGCEHIRHILRKQKADRGQNIKKKFDILSGLMDDYLNESTGDSL